MSLTVILKRIDKIMKFKKLKNIADIQTGLVLSRKGAKQLELIKQDTIEQMTLFEPVEYKVITLKSIDELGNIDINELDNFQSIEDLSDKYLTQENDIILRLFTPVYSCLIKKEYINLVIPSQCAVIRVTSDLITPDFLQLFLMLENIEEQLARNEGSTILRSIRTSSLGELKLPLYPIHKQDKIVKISQLLLKKEQLLNKLSEQQRLYNKAIIKSLIHNQTEI